MTLLVILGLVFAVVVLMVVIGEKFAKPLPEKDQSKYSKWIQVLVFILLIVAVVKAALD